MPSRSTGVLSTLGNILLVACAVLTTGMVVRRELRTPKPPAAPQRVAQLADWKSYFNGRHIGPASARAVMVEFSDFECPACRVFESRLRQARAAYPDDFAIIYRHLPIERHKSARGAAFASECAGQQDRFEPMHRLMFDSADSLGVLTWTDFAIRAGVADTVAFKQCMESPATAAIVARDSADAMKAGATGTPTLIFNGYRIAGAPTQQMLDSLIQSVVGRSND